MRGVKTVKDFTLSVKELYTLRVNFFQGKTDCHQQIIFFFTLLRVPVQKFAGDPHKRLKMRVPVQKTAGGLHLYEKSPSDHSERDFCGA